MTGKLYHYKANVVSVYDGDTIHADIDLGLYSWRKKEKIRLARINAPELRGAEKEKGHAARDYLRSRILGKDILLETIKDRRGKWGRFLGDIWLNEKGTWVNVNDEMVEKGFAKYVTY